MKITRWLTIAITFSCIRVGFNSEGMDISPRLSTVMIGDSTELICSKTSTTAIPVNWKHVPPGSSQEILVYNKILSGFSPNYVEDFSQYTNDTTGEFYSIIRNMTDEYAGTYICEDNDKQQTTVSSEIIVIDSSPVCSSNTSQGVLGENDCNLEPEIAGFTCKIRNYFGGKAPVLTWRNALTNDVVSIGVSNFTNQNTTRSHLAVEAAAHLNGSYFVCHVENVPVEHESNFRCQTDPLNIMHARNSSSSVRRDQVIGSVNCSSNSSLTCSYRWIAVIDSNDVVVRHQVIALTNPTVLNTPANFECIADCKAGQRTCSLKSFELVYTAPYVEARSYTTAIIIIVVVVVGALLVIVLAVVVVIYRRRKRTPSSSKDSNNCGIPLTRYPVVDKSTTKADDETDNKPDKYLLRKMSQSTDLSTESLNHITRNRPKSTGAAKKLGC